MEQNNVRQEIAKQKATIFPTPPYNCAVQCDKPSVLFEDAWNQNRDTLSLKRLPILLCNLKELLAQRASSTERGGISELWETIGLCFSFYNGAEPNKET